MNPEQSQAPAIVKTPIMMGERGLELRTLDDSFRFSQYLAASGLAPRGFEKPESIIVAVQLGAELGLTPMAALQNIGVINGKPGIYGDAALALARASKTLEWYKEEMVGTPGTDDFGCKCTCKRVGQPEATETFTVADAKQAGLWNKSGPWSQYPKRMLKWRARGFLLRDQFGDVLKGLHTVEELNDFTVIDVTPERGQGAAPASPESNEGSQAATQRPAMPPRRNRGRGAGGLAAATSTPPATEQGAEAAGDEKPQGEPTATEAPASEKPQAAAEPPPPVVSAHGDPLGHSQLGESEPMPIYEPKEAIAAGEFIRGSVQITKATRRKLKKPFDGNAETLELEVTGAFKGKVYSFLFDHEGLKEGKQSFAVLLGTVGPNGVLPILTHVMPPPPPPAAGLE